VPEEYLKHTGKGEKANSPKLHFKKLYSYKNCG
jgi:hypothetical protein